MRRWKLPWPWERCRSRVAGTSPIKKSDQLDLFFPLKTVLQVSEGGKGRGDGAPGQNSRNGHNASDRRRREQPFEAVLQAGSHPAAQASQLVPFRTIHYNVRKGAAAELHDAAFPIHLNFAGVDGEAISGNGFALVGGDLDLVPLGNPSESGVFHGTPRIRAKPVIEAVPCDAL